MPEDMILVPRESLEKLLLELAERRFATTRDTSHHIRTLKSLVGTHPKEKSRTLHSIDLYDEQKIGAYYAARTKDGMIAVHDGKFFNGGVTRWSTKSKRTCFKADLRMLNKSRVCQYLDQAENYVLKTLQKMQNDAQPNPKDKQPMTQNRRAK